MAQWGSLCSRGCNKSFPPGKITEKKDHEIACDGTAKPERRKRITRADKTAEEVMEQMAQLPIPARWYGALAEHGELKHGECFS